MADISGPRVTQGARNRAVCSAAAAGGLVCQAGGVIISARRSREPCDRGPLRGWATGVCLQPQFGAGPCIARHYMMSPGMVMSLGHARRKREIK